MKKYIFISYLLISFSLHSQNTKKTNSALLNFRDNNGTINLNSYYNQDKKKVDVLLVDKYLNRKKPIIIDFATNTITISPSQLQVNYSDSNYWCMFDILGKLFELKVKNGQIRIKCDVIGFDGRYIAKVRGDTLILGKHFHAYVSDRYFEIFDDYNIPLLQIELIKNTNTISISGVQHTDIGFNIWSDRGMLGYAYDKNRSSKWFMNEHDKEAARLYYITKCNEQIKAKHEE